VKPVAAAALLFAGWTAAAAAQDPPQLFQLPVDCDMEEVCSVQIYVDVDPTEGANDYACGHLTYDTSNGTDIRVRNLADMERGVSVLAAAPGVVLGTHDGMDDVSVSEIGVDALQGKFAGNGVGIDHGEGWFTQYSHLRKGSVRVKTGDRVEAGTPLGLIGLSGRTNYPHLEFTVRYDGEVVDPFVGVNPDFRCDQPRRTLWSVQALAAMPYRPAWLLSAGFADEPVKIDGIRRGDYALTALPADSPVLSFWIDYANVFAGDTYELTIRAPDGGILTQTVDRVEKTQYTFYAFTGLRRPAEGWPTGVYSDTFSVARDGRPVLSIEREIALR